LYSDIAKPLVDIALFAYKLGESIGAEAPVLMLAYFASSGYLLKRISPSFGKFIAIEQGLEGQFRYSHSRIIAHSEEIAFYRGADQEKTVANATFQKVSSMSPSHDQHVCVCMCGCVDQGAPESNILAALHQWHH
jgi:ATP-binding cassette subfamily D (ALD) protein 3